MTIIEATESYEHWLRSQIRIVEPDLAFKHDQMASAAFPFMRATYYRWAQTWSKICPAAAGAPQVLAVGDLHIENFGTWRDIEGRLVWGVNDFDEATPLPYTNDLIRLAASMILASAQGSAGLNRHAAFEALVEGYRKGFEVGGNPFVLAEHHAALRKMATGELRNPSDFWAKASNWPLSTTAADPSIRNSAIATFPPDAAEITERTRRAGLGSLGRQRYVYTAVASGGMVAREVKAMVPSAALWASGKPDGRTLYAEVLKAARRCSDPFTRVEPGWLIRRLAPDCSRIELSDLPTERDEIKLISAMGFETANVHLGTASKSREVQDHLKLLPDDWLRNAAQAMAESVLADYHSWSKELSRPR